MRYFALLFALCSASLHAAEQYPASDVEILGDIDYDQTNDALQCSGNQKFCSILFNGLSGDRVQVIVKGQGGGKPFVAITDGSLTELAKGSGEASVTLPDVTDKLATYYIVFRDSDGKPGKFSVALHKARNARLPRRGVMTAAR